MNKLIVAAQRLNEVEVDFRKLIGEMAAEGDYHAIETLVRWAGVLKSLCSEVPLEAKMASKPIAGPSETPATKPKTKHRSATRPAKTKAKKRYPFFAKSGDNLLKVAWSKSTKSEYSHKSPHKVSLLLASALLEKSKSSSVISMESVLPLKDTDGVEVPDYQAYVSLAWFRDAGFIEQNGRQGYSVVKADEFQTQIDIAWKQLADRK